MKIAKLTKWVGFVIEMKNLKKPKTKKNSKSVIDERRRGWKAL